MTDQTRLEREFSVPSPARLRLSNIRGRVRLQEGPAGRLSLCATQTVGPGETQVEIRLEQAPDGEVRVETRVPESGWPRLPGLPQPAAVEYEVLVPPGCAVRLDCVSSDAQVDGLHGELQARMVSGALRLRGVQGELELDTVSGAVHGEALQGTLRLSTVSGRVHLAAADFARLSVSTVSGRVALHTHLAGDSTRLKSVSGDIQLCLPAPQGCSISVHSLSGGVRTPLAHTRRGRAVEIEGGGVPIAFQSVSGSLSVDLDPAGPSTQLGAGPDRRQVLERVARGELSAEDALSTIL